MTAHKEPPACDPDVFLKGDVVFITHTIPSADIETWVNHVARLSEQRVDWHFAGGRACVKALGDLARVKEALRSLRAEHDEMFRVACMQLSPCNQNQDRATCKGIWKFNGLA